MPPSKKPNEVIDSVNSLYYDQQNEENYESEKGDPRFEAEKFLLQKMQLNQSWKSTRLNYQKFRIILSIMLIIFALF